MMDERAPDACLVARSGLFVPASRPDRFDKAAAAGADLVILDLEDSVGSDNKVRARADALSWLSTGRTAAVRVNDLESRWGVDDVEAVAEAGAVVMLPKATAESVARARALLRRRTPILALIETPRGVLELGEVCAVGGVVRLCFGGIDYALALGLDVPEGPMADDARARIAVASAANGLAPPMDGVTARLHAPDELSDAVAHAREFGFAGKLVIHPQQVAAVNEGFGPSADQLRWAREVMAASETGAGVFVLRGQMIDRPVVEQARRTLARAELFPDRRAD